MVLGAAALWASGATVGKDAFSRGVTPIQLVQVRTLVSALFLVVPLLVRGPGSFAVPAGVLPRLISLGGLALAGTQICYFEAVESAHVAVAILLQYMSVVLVFGFGAIAKRERVTAPRASALLAALAGCFLISGGADAGIFQVAGEGISWGLGAAVCFAAYTLGAEGIVRRIPASTALFYSMAVCAVVSHAIDPTLGYVGAAVDPDVLLRLLYVSVPGTLIPFWLYTAGIGRIGSTRASIAAVSEPVFAAAMALVLLGEVLSPAQVAGGALVVAAVALLRFKDVAKAGPIG